jgi:TRAP-type C4-dicarboxylate transport system substrate-binding protein
MKVLTKVLLFVFILAVCFSFSAAPADAAAKTTLKVLGQPLATGLIQKNKEQPFFENFAKNTGLDMDASYKAIDVTGIQSEETLRILKNGLFDIVSLRVAQAARDEPFLLGQDLVGLCPDYPTARKVYDSYKTYFDERLRTKFNGKLLGLWPFGPQVLFSKKPLTSLKDLKGMKVRVYDQSLAMFIEKLGGIPVPIGFSETQQALARGVVDAAITGASSANTAGWPEVSEYFMPIGFQVGFNGYAINLDSWKKMSTADQKKLQTAIDKLCLDIWSYSEELFDDAVRCNVGEEPCKTVNKYKMKKVAVSKEDLKLVSDAVMTISYPNWVKVTEKTYPGAGNIWQKAIAPIIEKK